jgi:hypothetical protein
MDWDLPIKRGTGILPMAHGQDGRATQNIAVPCDPLLRPQMCPPMLIEK